MYNNYSLSISKVLKGAENIMMEMHHPYVGTEHLLLSIMKNNLELSRLLAKYDLVYDDFKEELNLVVGSTTKKNICLYTPLLKRVIKNAQDLVGKEELNVSHLLIALIEEGEGIAIRIMVGMGIDIDKIYEELNKTDKNSKTKLELFNIGKDFNALVDDKDILVGREKEINLIIETLIRKNKNNPLLIGDAGVGKSAIVEELARLINRGNVPNALKNKKIVALEMSSLVAGTKYRGEFEEKLGKIIKELEQNPEIILFIDEIHTMSNAGGAEGAINASDILKPYLARGKIKIIGATTTAEYNKFISKDKALSRRFELIKIGEPDDLETINILEQLIPSFEKHYNIKISKDNIKDIVNLSNKYILDRYNPDKSIDLLDSICAMKEVESKKELELHDLREEQASTRKAKEESVFNNDFEKAVSLRTKEINLNKKIKRLEKLPNHIEQADIKQILFRKCNIPIIDNQNVLINNLQKHLHKKIIGQDKAIDQIVDALSINEEESPISILITGSTGVGKTLTVKEISKFLKMPLIRLDMSEYNADITVNRLIGSSAGYIGYDDASIFDKVKIYPHSCILLDEIEKAHPSVLNLFLQILDEGFVTNARGEKINFKNTYIFLTSNTKMAKNIGFLKNNTSNQESFSKEFLSRITQIVNFQDIDVDMVKKYVAQKGFDDIDIRDYDYHNLGLRGLDKYLNQKKLKCIKE